MPKMSTKGTGITATTAVHWDMREQGAAEALKAAVIESAAYGNDFERRIRRAEAWAKATFAGVDAEARFAEDSPEDFAGRLLDAIELVRAIIRDGDAAAAARSAVNLGILMAQAELKFSWEEFALSGQKSHLGHTLRDDYNDRQDFQRLVRRIYKERSPAPQTLKEWLDVPDLKVYRRKYKNATIRAWIREALPHSLKAGRPKKHTVIR